MYGAPPENESTGGTRIPCHGGPLDGEQRPDVGLYFTTVARLAEGLAGVVVRPGWSSGVYERREGGYYWRFT